MSTNKKTARKYSNRKRNYQKRDRDYTDPKEIKEDREGKNDISWHAKSETLLRECASIPWSWSTGKPIVLKGGYDTAPDVTYQHVLPGIMAMRTALTPGTGRFKTDALNIAAQALYTDVRRMLKSANAYESSDVMIYIAAVGEVLAYISWLTRIYATTMLYSFKNSYMPDDLLRIQGVNPTDLHNNALSFLSRANQLIAKASSIYMPKGLDYLTRCQWEYANYYSEGSDIKDQIYMITPGLFRAFSLDSSGDYKGRLAPIMRINRDSAYTADQLLDYLEDMLDGLLGDSDFSNIAGDLMMRYGESGVVTFSLIPQDAVMQIIDGPAAYEVLEAIQNSRCQPIVNRAWSDPQTYPSQMFNVMQGKEENQYLSVDTSTTWTFDTTYSRQMFIASAIASLLSVHEDPNPAKTMSITRFQNQLYGIEDAVTEAFMYVEAASDLVLCYDYLFHRVDGSTFMLTFGSTASTVNASYDEYIMKLRPFHYAPTMYLYNTNGVEDIYGALDVVAPISVEDLRDINRVDMMSLFAVPDVGKVTSGK